MSSINFGRTRVVRAIRNSAIVLVASLAAVQTAGAVLPNVANAFHKLANRKLFVNADSPARRQAEQWRRSRPADAAMMERIADQPVAQWIGDWTRDVRGSVASVMARAAQQGTTPVFVAYNIPNRDCGSYSAGGSNSASAYRGWIREFAAGLKGKQAVVVLEPDAVAGADCLSSRARSERYDLLRDAITVLKSARAVVYLDAGHAKWHSPDQIAQRLGAAGIQGADGFALNVSNYHSTSVNVAYGNDVSRRVGGKHYVIDTSRNGVGGRGSEWCNVGGQALGSPPTTNTGHALADAFLWIKQPGESDGTCSGGPRAGQWWPDYALGLARRQAVEFADAR